MNEKVLKEKAFQIRNEILEMTIKAGTGHLTSSLSCVEVLTALYYGGVMKYDPQNDQWEDRDYFIMSKGQASPILYVILADLGFFPKKDLDLFAQEGGKMGVHLQPSVPGSEIISGSLGCGFGIAAGIALSFKKSNKLNLVFSLLGDGECYEGSIWETAMFVGHNRLNNLITIVDRNYLCATHFTENELSLESLEAKWKAFNFDVHRIDGHNFTEILKVLSNLRSRKTAKPLLIIADTVKGKGIPLIENQPLWHGITVKGKDAEIARKQLNGGADNE